MKRNDAAHEALPIAAVQAGRLLANMKRGGALTQKQIVYEFHPQGDKWFPSYAELRDGRLVTDNNVLIPSSSYPPV